MRLDVSLLQQARGLNLGRPEKPRGRGPCGCARSSRSLRCAHGAAPPGAELSAAEAGEPGLNMCSPLPAPSLGGETLVLVVDVGDRRVRVRVVEDVECLLRLGADLQVRAEPSVADADLQLVGGRMPEERDLEAVVRAVGK